MMVGVAVMGVTVMGVVSSDLFIGVRHGASIAKGQLARHAAQLALSH